MAIDLNYIAEFSRCHCVGICTVLVPLNLLLSTTTIYLIGTNRSVKLIYGTAAVALWPAIVLFLHVVTWWSIGVVMLPTFILPILAITCLATHAYAVINPQQMRALLSTVIAFVSAKRRQLAIDTSGLFHH